MTYDLGPLTEMCDMDHTLLYIDKFQNFDTRKLKNVF